MTSKTVFTLSLALALVLLVLSSQNTEAASFGNRYERTQMFGLDQDDQELAGLGDRPRRDDDWINGGSGGAVGSVGSAASGPVLINEREPRETNVRRPLIFKRETNVRKPLLFKRYAIDNEFDGHNNNKRISSPLSRHWSRPRPAGRPTILYY